MEICNELGKTRNLIKIAPEKANTKTKVSYFLYYYEFTTRQAHQTKCADNEFINSIRRQRKTLTIKEVINSIINNNRTNSIFRENLHTCAFVQQLDDNRKTVLPTFKFKMFHFSAIITVMVSESRKIFRWDRWDKKGLRNSNRKEKPDYCIGKSETITKLIVKCDYIWEKDDSGEK